MLASGNYVQWKSRIKRYIDTKPNSELIHHCSKSTITRHQWLRKRFPVAEGSSETTTERYMENYKNVSQDIRDQLNAEAEAVETRKKQLVTSSAPTSYDPETATVTEDEECQRKVNVAGARENVGTPVVQKSGIQCYNCKEYGHVSRESDWKDDFTDEELHDQELEAHYMYMAQLQEVTPDLVDNSGPIFDDEPMNLKHDPSLRQSLEDRVMSNNTSREGAQSERTPRLNHNLFSVGQFCDADLEVAFRKSTCYIRDLKGNDLLTGESKDSSFTLRLPRAQKDGYNFYTWTYVVQCGSRQETPGVLIDFLTLVQRGLHAQVTTVRTDKGTEFLNKTLHAYFAKEGIRHETSTARTPEQNGVVEDEPLILVRLAYNAIGL
ncbi:retrovirus-related pol polyprotein from transposon TNT 1-94 [Tanacetum coccineum]